MNTRYLIVGAGLAGSCCAYLLQRAGADVVLLERLDARTKAKLCGGLVTPRSRKQLSLLFGSDADDLFTTAFDTMECVTEDYDIVLHDIELASLERGDLDRFVLDAYVQAGGVLVDRTRIDAFDFDRHCVSCTKVDGEELTCAYETLIAADGALSSTRRALTGEHGDAILTLETEVADGGAPLTMLYTQELFGYAWYIPVGGRAKIGCGSFRGADLDSALESFAQRMGVTYSTRRGAFLPTGKNVLLEKDDVFFLGDAAGLICPPSGEGIFYALFSARMLARSLLNKASYPALMAGKRAEVRREYALRDIFFNRRFMDMGIFAADHTPYGRERAVKYALRHFCSF